MTTHKTRRETQRTALRRGLELRGYELKSSKNGFRICDDTGFPVRETLTLDEAQAFLNELKEGDPE